MLLSLPDSSYFSPRPRRSGKPFLGCLGCRAQASAERDLMAAAPFLHLSLALPLCGRVHNHSLFCCSGAATTMLRCAFSLETGHDEGCGRGASGHRGQEPAHASRGDPVVRARGNEAGQGCRGEREGENKGGEVSNEQLLPRLAMSYPCLLSCVWARDFVSISIFRFNPIFIILHDETLVAVLVVGCACYQQ